MKQHLTEEAVSSGPQGKLQHSLSSCLMSPQSEVAQGGLIHHLGLLRGADRNLLGLYTNSSEAIITRSALTELRATAQPHSKATLSTWGAEECKVERSRTSRTFRKGCRCLLRLLLPPGGYELRLLAACRCLLLLLSMLRSGGRM